MIRASSAIQYSADVTFPPTPCKQHPPIPWVWLRGRAVLLDPGNSKAVNTVPGKPGRPFRGTLASSPSPLIRSLRKVIWLPYSFFRWLMKTNHLKFSLNWTPPPIFNMTNESKKLPMSGVLDHALQDTLGQVSFLGEVGRCGATGPAHVCNLGGSEPWCGAFCHPRSQLSNDEYCTHTHTTHTHITYTHHTCPPHTHTLIFFFKSLQ